MLIVGFSSGAAVVLPRNMLPNTCVSNDKIVTYEIMAYVPNMYLLELQNLAKLTEM